MCMEWFKTMICGEPENQLNPPEGLEKIGISELYTVLAAEFPDAKIMYADTHYATITKTELKKFLKANQIDLYKYIPEYYDCDDFSFALMGAISNPKWGSIPFGILWADVPGGAHAVNCFVDKARTVWVIEPQKDNIFRLPKDWKPYLVII